MQTQLTPSAYTMPGAVCTRLGVYEVPNELLSLVDQLDSAIANNVRNRDGFRADLERRILADVLERHARPIEHARSA
jgi:hypothetical protein